MRALPHDGFLLFMEQRTGKCLTSLAIVDKRKPKYLWIVCPINAIEVWRKEIQKHLHVDWNCKLIMMNYEEMASRVRKYDYRKKMGRCNRDDVMIIADELHKIKRRGSKVSRSLRILARRARYKLGLTGTPLGQGIHDAWAQFNFIDPEIFGPFDSKFDKETGEMIEIGFSDKYLIMGGFKRLKVIGSQNEDEFYEKFHQYSYRITLREARGSERPLKLRYRRDYFDLDPATRDIYDELESELIVEVNRKKVRAAAVVAVIMKLQQLTGGFVITEDGSPEIVGSEKLRRLIKAARILKEEKKKFVIVCRFLYEIERICARLIARGISCQVVSGGRKYDHKFADDCVVIQVQAGVAVDMAMADYTIFYSSDYSYLNHEQMRFRTLNFDKPTASFHYLLARDTIDEDIYQAVRRKKNVASVVLDKYRRRKQKPCSKSLSVPSPTRPLISIRSRPRRLNQPRR